MFREEWSSWALPLLWNALGRVLCGFQSCEESKSLPRSTGCSRCEVKAMRVCSRPARGMTGGDGVFSAVVFKAGSKDSAQGRKC